MCTLKCLGGMGFKDLIVFNDTLLRRQAWRLVRASNSLLRCVMKVKYFPSSDFLDASLSYSGSHSWRSIWTAKALVKEGSLLRVGDGLEINIWEAPWVADKNGCFIISPQSHDVTLMCHLIDPKSMERGMDLIDKNFNERYRRCILAILLNFPLQKMKLYGYFSRMVITLSRLHTCLVHGVI